MREIQHTVTFRCGHKKVSTITREREGFWSRLKFWERPKNEMSLFLCTHCAANSRRHAPPARGTSQTIAAKALGCQARSILALQGAQIRWAEVAALSKSKKVEEFSSDHQELAREAERTLKRIDTFWRSVHSEHITGISSDILSSSERGPDVCPLCREYLDSAIKDACQTSEDDDEYSPEDPEVCNRRLIEDALSRNGLYIQLDFPNQGHWKTHHRTRGSSTRPPRQSRSHPRRSRSALSDTTSTKLSTITGESRSRNSEELSKSSESQSDSPGLWRHLPKTMGTGIMPPGSAEGVQGLWQHHRGQRSVGVMYPFVVENDSSRPPLQRQQGSLNIIKFNASHNSLWQAPKPAPPPKMNPDSLEGGAAIQRIRNHLNFPDATPLELLCIRRLPESFTDVDRLLEYSDDMLAVAWKKEEEDAAKIIRATKPDPHSFDGKQTLERIKRLLNLPDSATIADVLSISTLPDALVEKKDIETLFADLDFISWGDKYESQVKRLREMVSGAL